MFGYIFILASYKANLSAMKFGQYQIDYCDKAQSLQFEYLENECNIMASENSTYNVKRSDLTPIARSQTLYHNHKTLYFPKINNTNYSSIFKFGLISFGILGILKICSTKNSVLRHRLKKNKTENVSAHQ